MIWGTYVPFKYCWRSTIVERDSGNWSSFQLAINLDQRISYLGYCPKRKDKFKARGWYGCYTIRNSGDVVGFLHFASGISKAAFNSRQWCFRHYMYHRQWSNQGDLTSSTQVPRYKVDELKVHFFSWQGEVCRHQRQCNTEATHGPAAVQAPAERGPHFKNKFNI